ncbi:MAG TPA: hypothetical protein VEX68_15965 [Bryobacteraceae bacterium]|nr:hypothetical protein [Bryobacteraceae bacterium]
MTNVTTHTIVGFFPTRERAESAVSELIREGFSREDISVVASNKNDVAVTSSPETPNLGPIKETGSTNDTGEKAVIGGMAGFIAGIVALAIPGIGPVIAAGPLAMALTGAAAGAATGGLIGVMTNDGIPEDAAQRYSHAIGAGHVMVTVRASSGRADDAAGILDQSGAVEIDEPSERLHSAPPVGVISTEGVKAARLDESSSLVNRQRQRERRVNVYPGITGGETST